MSRIVLEIVTPERQVFFDTVDEVSLPALRGYLTVLPGHTPVLCALGTGVIAAREADGRVERLAVSGGVAEISESRVIVLADWAKKAADINPEQTQTDLAAAEKLLAGDADQVVDGTRRSAIARASLEASDGAN